MAQLQYKCGCRLSNTEVPNNIQYHVFSDIEWENILRNDIISPLSILRPEHDVWKCSNCERVYIFSNDGSVLKVYKIEDEK